MFFKQTNIHGRDDITYNPVMYNINGNQTILNYSFKFNYRIFNLRHKRPFTLTSFEPLYRWQYAIAKHCRTLEFCNIHTAMSRANETIVNKTMWPAMLVYLKKKILNVFPLET